MNNAFTLNVLHWNINQKHKNIDTPEMIVTEILKEKPNREKPDIIVLTEFLKTQNYEDAIVRPLEDNGYVVFLDPRNAKKYIRQILIAVRKSAIDTAQFTGTIPIFLPDNEGHLFEDNDSNGYPNFLRVDLSLCGTPVSVIGVRIRTNINPPKKKLSPDERQKEHRFRQRQLQYLLQELPADRKIIMLGDFNIDESFVDDKKENWDYNRHYLPCLNFSNLQKFAAENTANSLSGLKLDHLILSNDFSAIDVQYDDKWEQKKANNYPDHPILTAMVVAAEIWTCSICGRNFPIGEFSNPSICDECAING